MKAKIEIDLKPFTVPNFVVPEVGGDGLPLSVLDSLTLDRMCREFRASVFQKAGKEMPPDTGSDN